MGEGPSLTVDENLILARRAWSVKKKAARGELPARLFASLRGAAGGLALSLGFGLLLGFEVFAGLLIDHLHGQPYLAALVEAQELDLHLLPFRDDVGGLLHPARGELADMDEAVLGTEEVHEGAEVHHLDD